MTIICKKVAQYVVEVVWWDGGEKACADLPESWHCLIGKAQKGAHRQLVVPA